MNLIILQKRSQFAAKKAEPGFKIELRLKSSWSIVTLEKLTFLSFVITGNIES